MKVVLIPLFPQASNGSSTGSSAGSSAGRSFKADWCLNLHGFLSREEFATRLDQINNQVKDVKIMNENMKSILYLLAMISTSTVSFIFTQYFKVIGFFASINSWFVVCFLIKYIIERIALARAEKFCKLLNELFERYNENDNPIANWKIWWVTSYERYISGKDGRAYGNGRLNVLKLSPNITFAPLFTDNVLIIIEVNDVLPVISDLTTKTIRANIELEANSPITNMHL
ncbi:19329_t:CDS:1, partial [Racocetra persica]